MVTAKIQDYCCRSGMNSRSSCSFSGKYTSPLITYCKSYNICNISKKTGYHHYGSSTQHKIYFGGIAKVATG